MNEVSISNFALAQVGADALESMDERTREARIVKTVFDLARDASLRAHDWPFARRQAALALLTEATEPWAYCYAYPADCLAAREIVNPAGLRASPVSTHEPIPYGIGVNTAGSTKTILTDQEDAVLLYTRKVTNPALFDPLFAEALGWRLASMLAIPLRGDMQLQRSLIQIAISTGEKAKAVGANEQRENPSGSGGLMASRA